MFRGQLQRTVKSWMTNMHLSSVRSIFWHCIYWEGVKLSPVWGRRQGNSRLSGCPGPTQHPHLAPSLLLKMHTQTKTQKHFNCTLFLILYSSHILDRCYFTNTTCCVAWTKALFRTYYPPTTTFACVMCCNVCVNTYMLRELQSEVCVLWQVEGDQGCGWQAVCQRERYCSLRYSIDPVKLEIGLKRQREKLTEVNERDKVVRKVDITKPGKLHELYRKKHFRYQDE